MSMQIYCVGGAIRDELLGLPVKDRDWVVVGATPEMLLAQGYKPVGKDFPVFLHPRSRDEYALARTERKTAPGYAGFVFHTDPAVTLEEDLARRDLGPHRLDETFVEQALRGDPAASRPALHRGQRAGRALCQRLLRGERSGIRGIRAGDQSVGAPLLITARISSANCTLTVPAAARQDCPAQPSAPSPEFLPDARRVRRQTRRVSCL